MTPMESASDQKIRERLISSVSYALEDYPASAKCSCCRSASRAAEPTSAATELGSHQARTATTPGKARSMREAVSALAP